MRTANTNLSNEQATKQLRQFSVASLICSAVGLAIFWWLGIVGIAFSARALVLATHKASKVAKATNKYHILAVIGLVVGIADLVLFSLGS